MLVNSACFCQFCISWYSCTPAFLTEAVKPEVVATPKNTPNKSNMQHMCASSEMTRNKKVALLDKNVKTTNNVQVPTACLSCEGQPSAPSGSQSNPIICDDDINEKAIASIASVINNVGSASARAPTTAPKKPSSIPICGLLHIQPPQK